MIKVVEILVPPIENCLKTAWAPRIDNTMIVRAPYARRFRDAILVNLFFVIGGLPLVCSRFALGEHVRQKASDNYYWIFGASSESRACSSSK